MTDITGRDYIETPQLLADALRYLPVPRTGLPLASTQGTSITYFTQRVLYENEIFNALPCILIDVNSNQSSSYKYEGTTLNRGIPLVVVALTPVTAYLDDVTDAADRDARILAADTDIKTMMGDMETIFNSEEVRRRVGKHVEVVRSILPYDDMHFEENTRIRARIIEFWLNVSNYVRNH